MRLLLLALLAVTASACDSGVEPDPTPINPVVIEVPFEDFFMIERDTVLIDLGSHFSILNGKPLTFDVTSYSKVYTAILEKNRLYVVGAQEGTDVLRIVALQDQKVIQEASLTVSVLSLQSFLLAPFPEITLQAGHAPQRIDLKRYFKRAEGYSVSYAASSRADSISAVVTESDLILTASGESSGMVSLVATIRGAIRGTGRIHVSIPVKATASWCAPAPPGYASYVDPFHPGDVYVFDLESTRSEEESSVYGPYAPWSRNTTTQEYGTIRLLITARTCHKGNVNVVATESRSTTVVVRTTKKSSGAPDEATVDSTEFADSKEVTGTLSSDLTFFTLGAYQIMQAYHPQEFPLTVTLTWGDGGRRHSFEYRFTQYRDRGLHQVTYDARYANSSIEPNLHSSERRILTRRW